MPRMIQRSALVLLSIAPIEAHSFQTPGRDANPQILFGLIVFAVWYALGVSEFRASRAWARARFRTFTFAAGWLALTIALVPLHHLSERLFAAHMTQHELLMLAAAPLLVLARPLPVLLKAIPPSVRRPLVRVAHERSVAAITRFFTSIFVAALLHAIILWTWHIPALFDGAVASDALHAVQHASFLGSALLFWHAVFDGPRRHLGYGVAVLYVFSTALHNGLLGAMLTFSTQPWYASYQTGFVPSGLTPVEDQQLGGLIMWIPACSVYIIAGLALFAGWLRDSDVRAAQAQSICIARA